MLSASSHKLHGPKGVGILYIRERLPIKPLLNGGGQENGVRSGTENVPGIVGFGKALEIISEGMAGSGESLDQLKKKLVQQIETKIPGAVLISP